MGVDRPRQDARGDAAQNRQVFLLAVRVHQQGGRVTGVDETQHPGARIEQPVEEGHEDATVVVGGKFIIDLLDDLGQFEGPLGRPGAQQGLGHHAEETGTDPLAADIRHHHAALTVGQFEMIIEVPPHLLGGAHGAPQAIGGVARPGMGEHRQLHPGGDIEFLAQGHELDGFAKGLGHGIEPGAPGRGHHGDLVRRLEACLHRQMPYQFGGRPHEFP